MSCLDDGKRKTERGWSPGDSLNLVRVLSVRVNYSQQCRNDINGRWEYSKSIMSVFWLKFSLKFVLQSPIDNKSSLVQVMAWQLTDAYNRHQLSMCYKEVIPVGIHEPLTHWGRDNMAAIFQTTFSNAFSWLKMFEFRLQFHWNLFPRVKLTIFQHWFR